MDIKWEQIRQYTINVGALDKPSDICKIFKDLGIDWYIYEIFYEGQGIEPRFTIKYGMSADNSFTHGERLYRQIAHCPSWGRKAIFGHSGADFFVIIHQIKEKFGIDIDHTKLKIKVCDLTNYKFDTIDYWDEINKMESYFIDSYIKMFGVRPIGNINDEHKIKIKSAIRKDTFETLFDAGK